MWPVAAAGLEVATAVAAGRVTRSVANAPGGMAGVGPNGALVPARPGPAVGRPAVGKETGAVVGGPDVRVGVAAGRVGLAWLLHAVAASATKVKITNHREA